MAQLVLIVDLAHGCLIFTGMFIVSVIVVILRAGRRVLAARRHVLSYAAMANRGLFIRARMERRPVNGAALLCHIVETNDAAG
jgi:hypothetical protein